jgi:hypothetical protein
METNNNKQADYHNAASKLRTSSGSFFARIGILIIIILGGIAGYFASDTITSFCGASISGPALGKLATWFGATVKPSTPVSWLIGCTVAGCVLSLIAIKAVKIGVQGDISKEKLAKDIEDIN